METSVMLSYLGRLIKIHHDNITIDMVYNIGKSIDEYPYEFINRFYVVLKMMHWYYVHVTFHHNAAWIILDLLNLFKSL
jgi:hypothetical protein